MNKADRITRTVGEVLALPNLSMGVRAALVDQPDDLLVFLHEKHDGSIGLAVCPESAVPRSTPEPFLPPWWEGNLKPRK
jgi:hypothetical protein